MSPLRKRWKTIWNIPRLIKSSWALVKNPRVPADTKFILFLLGLAYFIWPFDLIPDIPIPLLGFIDDFSVIFFLLNWFVNRSARDEYINADYYFIDDDNGNDKDNRE